MSNENLDRNPNQDNNDNASLKPDPETLHKTDPQENMEGPVSSIIHNTGEGFDTKETAEEANEEKDRKM